MKEVERLLKEERWDEAAALIVGELADAPESHWLWMTLGLTYYERRLYEVALRCSKRALALAPKCPLVLWHHAGTLGMCGREGEALAHYAKLRAMDPESVAHDECGEGMPWALRLLNDTHYRMAKLYERAGDTVSAAASLRKYLHNRAHGVASTYGVKDAEGHLARMGEGGAS